MGSTSKRQQTMAKRAREQSIREKRERKAEKKAARAAARNGENTDATSGTDAVDGEAGGRDLELDGDAVVDPAENPGS